MSAPATARRHPDWIRVRVPGGEGAATVHLTPLAEPYELLACARDEIGRAHV